MRRRRWKRGREAMAKALEDEMQRRDRSQRSQRQNKRNSEINKLNIYKCNAMQIESRLTVE